VLEVMTIGGPVFGLAMVWLLLKWMKDIKLYQALNGSAESGKPD
jgi:hypothetical protein